MTVDPIALSEIELMMRKLAHQVKNDTIEACAKAAEAAIPDIQKHYGVAETVGADIAARRIRALTTG